MSSVNKLSLKEFIKTSSKQNSNPDRFFTKNIFTAKQLVHEGINNSKINNEEKNIKNLKLNTLPCEQVQNQNQKFLFRSTWEGDIQQIKEEMKGITSSCRSPTFATQILSQNNGSNLFPAYQNNNNQRQKTVEKQQSEKCLSQQKNRSNSRKNNKSLKKFIGDMPHQHRATLSTTSVIVKNTYENENQNQKTALISGEEQTLYHISMLELENQQLKRQNFKAQQKLQDIKQKFERLKQQNQEMKMGQSNTEKDNKKLMSNEQLLQRMQNQSFWKFYLKAQKLILSSSNQKSQANPVNFMKQLQALREVTSQMKKQIKSLKKSCEQKEEEIQKQKDKINITETDIEEMRLKCVAYENSLKKMKDQNKKLKIQMEKVSDIKGVQIKIEKLTKQIQKKDESLSELKILYEQCDKQRINSKKKVKSLDDQIVSLNKQLTNMKMQIKQLQIQREELLANKKELIQKQRLKEKNFQLQKELKNIILMKDSQSKQKEQYQKELQIKDSQVRQLDTKVEKITDYMQNLESEKKKFEGQIEKTRAELDKLRKQYNFVCGNYRNLEELYKQSQQQKQKKLSQLSQQLQQLTVKFNQQQKSIFRQNELISKLTKQNQEKEQSLKIKEYESVKLKQSLFEKEKQFKEKYLSKKEKQNLDEIYGNNRQKSNKILELEQYIRKIQSKHNEALDMYENLFNEKVEIQMQLQVLMQKQQKNSHNDRQSIDLNGLSEDLMTSIKSMLMVKQEIIKKILIFCPQQFKQLIVDYIYHGDMVEQKYIDLIYEKNTPNNGKNNNETDYSESEQSSMQENSDIYESNDDYDQQYSQVRPSSSTMRNNRYNKTRPYPKKNVQTQKYHPQKQDRTEEEIYQLMEKFLYIGKIIEKTTKSNIKKNRNSTNKYERRLSNEKGYYRQQNNKQNAHENYVHSNMHKKNQSRNKPIFHQNNSNSSNDQNYDKRHQFKLKMTGNRDQNYEGTGNVLFKKSHKNRPLSQINNLINQQNQGYELNTNQKRQPPIRQKYNQNACINNNFNPGSKNINLMQMMERMKLQ